MLSELLRVSDRATIRQTLDYLNAVDISEAFEELDEKNAVRVFRLLSKDTAAEVFTYLDSDLQQNIIEAITDKEIGDIINELFLDDAVDFIDEMPANVVKRVLANATPSKRALINRFLQYPDDSVGSIMTIEYVDLKSGMTVADAFARIRSTGANKETIYTCYVTDSERKLSGVVSAKTLFLSEKESLIRDIMEPNVIFTRTYDDKEEVIDSFRKYGYLAIPVVDREDRLVGIVTYDDVFIAQEEETTEDFEKMAAMLPSEDPYLKTSVLTMSKNRIIWLVLLNLSVFLTGVVVEKHEDIIAALPVLVTFMPLLMDTSGDAGSQSSTLIIRGMALGEIKMSDAFRVFFKELRVALICGGVLSIVNFARVVFFGSDAAIALTVSLALYSSVILSKTTGAILPIIAKVIKLDPAVMAGPMLTTVVDAVSLTVYFNLALILIGI
jgi:magnesium transporter